jgi:hypothetical protein
VIEAVIRSLVRLTQRDARSLRSTQGALSRALALSDQAMTAGEAPPATIEA